MEDKSSTPTNQRHSMKHFAAASFRRLVERFERHYTPKHGSGSIMAEAELQRVVGSMS